MSRIRTSWPGKAASSAIPWPISPAPITASRIVAVPSWRKGGPELNMWWAAPKVHRLQLLRSDVDPVQTLIVFAAMAIAVIMPFVVVPEILAGKGFNPKSGSVRSLVSVSFLLIVFVRAVASWFRFSLRNLAAWAYLPVGLVLAIL